MRIIDAEQYIEGSRVFEKNENKNIMIFIEKWLNNYKNDIQNRILSVYYNEPESIDLVATEFISDFLNDYYIELNTIFENMKYVPIEPPFYTLGTMVDEVYSSIPDPRKISNIVLKNITKYNFTESKMSVPNIHIENIDDKITSIPNVLSMTVIYHHNPLMWPLIFHEYGHTIFPKVNKEHTYKEINKTIKKYCDEKVLGINQIRLNKIISEAFSDLFAINHYRSNYLLAFYFHEISSSNIEKLLNIENNEFKIKDHPPSAIRLKHMIKELNDKGYDKNDDVLKKLIECHEPFNQKIQEVGGIIEDDVINFYELVYNEISKLFPKNDEIVIDKKLINKLHKNLNKKQPIATSRLSNVDFTKSSNFDVESNNKIIDIISAAWKYLFLDMIIKLYEMPDYKKYLPNNEKEFDNKKTKIDNLFFKFQHEYKFLNKNINYSIETSVIVSNFIEDLT